MKPKVNRILKHAVFAVVLFISCGQQSSLIAVQDSASKPMASRSDLSPTNMRYAIFSADESKVVTWQSSYSPGFLGPGITTLDGMQVWDFATNEILSVNQFPVFDPAGKWFALNREGAVVVFDSNTGKEITQLEDRSAGHLHFLQPSYLISIKPTGEAREDDVVRVWNTHTWEAMRPTLIKGRHLSEFKMSMVDERAIQYLFEDGHLLILMPSGAFEYHDLIQGKNKSENKSIAEDFRKLTDDRFRPHQLFNPTGHSCFSYTINSTAIQVHAHTEDGRV